MATPNLGTLSAPLPGSPPAAGGAASPDMAMQGGQPMQAGAPAPATSPEHAAGQAQLAHARIQIALSLLNSSLSMLEPGSQRHKAVMDVTRRLSREFAGGQQEQAQSLAKSETDLLQSQANQTGVAPLNA